MLLAEVVVRSSFITGLSFGLTSGIITTLGMMVGLTSGTNSKLAVIGGILTIAIADAFSDALGIHISEESKLSSSHSEVWESTIATFIAKFLFALSFVLPVIFLELGTAVVVNLVMGTFLMGGFSLYMSIKNDRPFVVALEHIAVALTVVILSHFTGKWINSYFG